MPTYRISVPAVSISEHSPHFCREGKYPQPRFILKLRMATQLRSDRPPRAVFTVSSPFIKALAQANKSVYKLRII